MKLRCLALLLPFVAAAGCATGPSDATVAAGDVKNSEVSCDRTYRTGSRLPKKDCGPALTPEERAHAQEDISRIRPGSSQLSAPGK